MDIASGQPYWSVLNGLPVAFPPLSSELTVETLIIGGGITGALIARELAENDHDVALIELLDIGRGSTSASTALLQYEIDTPMSELQSLYGWAAARLAYTTCATAIDGLRAIAREYPQVPFQNNASLYVASRRLHVKTLAEELELRKSVGLKVDWLDQNQLATEWNIRSAFAAILSSTAASVDPYALTYAILDRLRSNGTSIFDRSGAQSIESVPRGYIVRTTSGAAIRCRRIIVATGYSALQQLGESVAKLRSTYAFVTEPMSADELSWLRDTLFWETARPYLYSRSTVDGRFLLGGEDDQIDIPIKRDFQISRKTKRLINRMKRFMPDLTLRPSYAWAGTFAETQDGLPYFGPHRKMGPNVHFAMAYGGNGITYSFLGAEILRARIEGRPHPLMQLYSFERTE